MGHFCLVFSLIAQCLFLSTASADFTAKGRIRIKDSIYYLQFDNKKMDYLIIAVDDLVHSHLQCLKEGDYLSGTAKIINGSHVALKSVEYVGLKALLANWRNDNEVFYFSDFKTFYYWQFQKSANRFRGPFPYHYILSPNGRKPSDPCSWKIFITNDVEVVYGVLRWMTTDRIRMDLYDSNTGEIHIIKHLHQSTL